MQKVIDFLEQQCQWIAIGLGALFALFMVYTYVLQPPAKVMIGQDSLTSGEVDPYVLEHVGKTLEGQFEAPGKIDLVVPKYVQSLMSAMNWTGAKPIDFAGAFPSLPPLQDTVATSTSNPQGPGEPNAPDVTKVTQLPAPPAPILVSGETKFGRSVIVPPTAPGQPAAVVQPQTGQPAVAGIDKDWVTQEFHINPVEIAKAFAAVKIPAKFNTTMLLQVEMQRVEVDDNGNDVPGTQKIIPPMDVWRASVAPPPFPPEDAHDQQGPYMQWAAANTADILEPLFYTVLKGDQWVKPGSPAAAAAAFDPATFKGDLGSLPKDQFDAVMKARRDKAKADLEAKKAAHPARPSTPSGGAPGGGAAGFSPFIPNFAPAPGSHQPPRPPAAAGRGGYAGGDGVGAVGVGAPPPEGPMGFNPNMAGGPAAMSPASLPQAGTDYPAGDFDPADPKWNTKNPDGTPKMFDGWCHDQTVIATKTYRYQIRYKLKNPVLGSANVTEPPELSNTFAIVSPWSTWSSPITIPPLINFFVAGNRSPNGTVIQFQVFKWEKGEQRSASFPVAPGDEVGGIDPKLGIDFATGWSVVDFREDPRSPGETQILLVNDTSGKLVARSFRADQSDPLYKGLKEQVIAAKALETAAAGGAGGAPPAIR